MTKSYSIHIIELDFSVLIFKIQLLVGFIAIESGDPLVRHLTWLSINIAQYLDGLLVGLQRL